MLSTIAFIQGTILINSFLLREGKVHYCVPSWTLSIFKSSWIMPGNDCWFVTSLRPEGHTLHLQTTGKKILLLTVLNIVLLTHPYCFMIQVLNTALFIGVSLLILNKMLFSKVTVKNSVKLSFPNWSIISIQFQSET